MADIEKIDTLISEVQELRESIDELSNQFFSMFGFMREEFKRADESRTVLIVAGSKKNVGELEIDGAVAVVVPSDIDVEVTCPDGIKLDPDKIDLDGKGSPR